MAEQRVKKQWRRDDLSAANGFYKAHVISAFGEFVSAAARIRGAGRERTNASPPMDFARSKPDVATMERITASAPVDVSTAERTFAVVGTNAAIGEIDFVQATIDCTKAEIGIATVEIDFA